MAETESFTVQAGSSGVTAVRVRLTDADYLHLNEVEVLEQGTASNLAVAGTATQSSTYNGNTGPEKAIDGDTVTGYPTSVSQTQNEFGAWWEVDLGGGFDVGTITVYNRDSSGRRLEDAVVEALDSGGSVVWFDTITGARDGSIHSFVVSIGPDTTPPTADLADPTHGGTINLGALNGRGYLDVSFVDTGDSGLDTTTIDGDELTLGGAGVGTATLSGTATLVSGSTYRYGFTGDFVVGSVDVNFVAGTWQDNAGNANVAETESFTVMSLNDAPVVSDIPNQTTAEGSTFAFINLDDYVSDADNTDAEMTWTASGNSELTVSIDANRVVTITIPDADWNGSETITFAAVDPGSLSDSDAATFTVTAVNDAPVVADIPDQTISEGSTFAFVNLDDYVSDADNTDVEMTWTVSGNSELTVSIDVNRVATITIPDADWNGSETITFRATDPGTLFDEDVSIFNVTTFPILLINSVSNPFSLYYAEILRTEGFNAFDVVDIDSVTTAVLGNHDIVILGEVPLSSAQVTTFSDWVLSGGNLITMRPDKQLSTLLGLTDDSLTLSDAYLLVDTSKEPGAGIVDQTIQFHGTADLYTVNDASIVATLYTDSTTATDNPAVTLRSVGTAGGQVAAFTYDLARSVVYTRQGNPDWAGQERDGVAGIRTSDLFFGAADGDPQPDWVDLNKVAIPQADEQQRLLANMINHMNFDKKPLPRFWYFPRGEKAVVIMTGDDHGTGGTAARFDSFIASSASDGAVDNWESIRSSSYIYPDTPLTAQQAAAYTSAGFEIGLHVNAGAGEWTSSSLESFYSEQLAAFHLAYPGLPSPSSIRTHRVSWSDYATQPKIELSHGIRLDTNYYFFPSAWVADRPGLFTGSGIPMRFADVDGTMIDVYQAATQLTDESGQSYPFTIDTLLDRALGSEGYYGAFTVNMHTDRPVTFSADTKTEAIIDSALSRGVPVVSGRQMLEWLDGRGSSSYDSLAWEGNNLNFSVTVGTGANGLQVMLPVTSAVGTVIDVRYDGDPIPYTIQTIKGVNYVFFSVVDGTYSVVYGFDINPPQVVDVAVDSITSYSANITWETDEPADSRIEYGTVSGSYTLFEEDMDFDLPSHSMTLSGLSSNTTYYYRVQSEDPNGNLTSSTEASFATAPQSLVAAYSFNEGLGASANDASGNGNTGTILGATWMAGQYGGALSFDGVDDHVDIPNSDSLNITGDAVTISLWAKAGSQNSDDYLVGKSNGAGTNGYSLYTGNLASLRFFTGTGERNRTPDFGFAWDNQWHHLAGVYDGNTVSIYVDGELQASGIASGSIVDSSSHNLTIGSYNDASSSVSRFNGLIDEVRIYNEALSQKEIQSDMNTPIDDTPDTTLPTVSIASPVNDATVGKTINVEVDAADDTGISYVELYIDGALLAGDTLSPYQYVWDTTLYANGPHTLMARAYDVAGNSADSADVIIEIDDSSAPVVSDIPAQTIVEGSTFASINLDDFVSDIDHTDVEMTWTASGNSELTVTIDANRIATVTMPDADWNGSETITFRATDPGTLYGEDAAIFTVTAVNDAPVVSDIPDQTITGDSTFASINLDDYVSNIDHTDAEMTWTSSGNSELTVTIDANRVATVTMPDAEWSGSETITFRATDPGTLHDEDAATFTVTAVNDAPVVSDIPDQTVVEGATFASINLDDYVSDADNTDAEMTWTASANSELTVSIDVNRVATITIPGPDWNGSETITFRATDPGTLYNEDLAIFMVAGVLLPTLPFEQFTNSGDSFDLEYTRVLFTPGPTGTTYDISVGAITGLPTDPGGGSGLALGDDASQSVSLSDGHTVSLYGQSFSSFYVGSNGYLTFTAADNDFSESVEDHFDALRVSALFDDLDPTAGGTISILELSDRVVITWEGISEYGQANSNTLQVEMYYDGRIQLAWLNVDATDGLVGLSDGLGVRPELTEIDLSAPVVTDIPDQTIAQGSAFASINLDDYVSHIDNTDAEMIWTASGNSELTVSIDVNRVATVTIPDAGWSGSETITFRAADPGALFDEDIVVFTVNADTSDTMLPTVSIASPVNDSTVGKTINVDVDAADNIGVSFVELYIDGALFASDAASPYQYAWDTTLYSNGPHTLMARAYDAAGNFADSADVTIEIDDSGAPVVSDIPDQTIAEGSTFASINLDDFVSDIDHTDAEMTWTASGNSELTVTIDANRVATVTMPDTDWIGSETITFRATDPGAFYDENIATFTVTAVNDAPVVSDIPDQTIVEGLTFASINLDDYVSDIDHTDAEMTWTASGNSELTVSIDANRVATVTIPDANWSGSETITFRATDPGTLYDEDLALFTVDGVPLPTLPYEQFTSGDSFDLENTRVLLTPGPTGTTYDISVGTITDLPTDPTGGSELTLGDDASQSVSLNNGHTVSLYGQSFSSFYVGSNGFLTFTGGDSDFSESVEDHFDTLRVSALFDDLDPTAGGTISILELSDRVVITWEGISEFGQANSNTFQVEMYYDGRIQLAWLNISAIDGLVGLSDGLGTRPGLTEVDLSAL